MRFAAELFDCYKLFKSFNVTHIMLILRKLVHMTVPCVLDGAGQSHFKMFYVI